VDEVETLFTEAEEQNV